MSEERVFASQASKGGWERYQELVMSEIKRLDKSITSWAEKYQDELGNLKKETRDDLETIRMELRNLENMIARDRAAYEAGMRVAELEQELKTVQGQAEQDKANIKVETFMEKTNKLSWLLIGGIVSLGFFGVQTLVKIVLKALGIDF